MSKPISKSNSIVLKYDWSIAPCGNFKVVINSHYDSRFTGLGRTEQLAMDDAESKFLKHAGSITRRLHGC